MKNIICLLWALIFILSSCDRFLDVKSNSKLGIAETLEDNQAILDRSQMTTYYSNSAEISSDDYYVTDADFDNNRFDYEKMLYKWNPDQVSRPGDNDWTNLFSKIVVHNTILDNIKHYKFENAENLKGQALVYRAAAYLEAAQIWCLAYDQSTASTELGLPLRLTADMNVPSVRTTLDKTYEQILDDLHTAAELLPNNQISIVRPSKVTALGFLSRVYLYMGDYEKSLLYGSKALAINSKLLDYNHLNENASYPFEMNHAELLFSTSMTPSYFLHKNRIHIDENFYNSYDDNDLRKTLQFTKKSGGGIGFRGNYAGSSLMCSALAADELYLNVAESYAQLGQISKAMDQLNQLLITRWKQGAFVGFTADSKADAIELIRIERRKELLIRGLRWADIKRYNRDGANITLSRTIKGETFTLPPNDLRYAIAIPEEVIEMSGMPKNKR
ncbi:RagB/SusD family nutrient uptake outer membrane protein [Chryseobacterium sp. A321]